MPVKKCSSSAEPPRHHHQGTNVSKGRFCIVKWKTSAGLPKLIFPHQIIKEMYVDVRWRCYRSARGMAVISRRIHRQQFCSQFNIETEKEAYTKSNIFRNDAEKGTTCSSRMAPYMGRQIVNKHILLVVPPFSQ